jgi:hypothetical protein
MTGCLYITEPCNLTHEPGGFRPGKRLTQMIILRNGSGQQKCNIMLHQFSVRQCTTFQIHLTTFPGLSPNRRNFSAFSRIFVDSNQIERKTILLYLLALSCIFRWSGKLGFWFEPRNRGSALVEKFIVEYHGNIPSDFEAGSETEFEG